MHQTRLTPYIVAQEHSAAEESSSTDYFEHANRQPEPRDVIAVSGHVDCRNFLFSDKIRFLSVRVVSIHPPQSPSTMDVRALLSQSSDENSFTSVSFQPNYVQSLHNLLTQSTSNDTATLKAVRLIVRAKPWL